MQMSATELGRFYGLTGEEMNRILFKQGFLDGIPGDYTVTDKGAKYAIEHYHQRGNGGYSRYNVGWTTILYDGSIMEELDITDEIIEEVRTELSVKRQRRNAERAVARERIQEMIISSDEEGSEEDRNEIFGDFESYESQITDDSIKQWIIGIGIVGLGITICKATLYVKKLIAKQKDKTKEVNTMKCNSCGCSFDKQIAVDRFDENHGSGYYEFYFPNNDFCNDCAEHLYDEEMARRNASAYDFDPHDPDAY